MKPWIVELTGTAGLALVAYAVYAWAGLPAVSFFAGVILVAVALREAW